MFMEEKSCRKFHYFLLWFCMYLWFKLSIPSGGFCYGWSFCYPPCCSSTVSSQNSKETTVGSFFKRSFTDTHVCRVIIQSVLPVYESTNCLKHKKFHRVSLIADNGIINLVSYLCKVWWLLLCKKHFLVLLLYYVNIKTGIKT